MERPGPVDPTPPGARLATAAALAPFAAAAGGLWAADGAWRVFLFLTGLNYALAALAFLGAVHLGFALAAAARGTTVPRLWWAYPFAPGAVGAGALASGTDWLWLIAAFLAAFVASHAADLRAVRRGLAPGWYGTVRRWVTGAALLWGGSALVHAPATVGG